MPKTIPSWAIDAGIALLLAFVSYVAERVTQGQLFTDYIYLVVTVALGVFVLLRGGNLFAKAGTTLGCLYVFAITWILPCSTALIITGVPRFRDAVQNSPAFFVLAGFYLLAIMGITFERMRRNDERRVKRAAATTPPPAK